MSRSVLLFRPYNYSTPLLSLLSASALAWSASCSEKAKDWRAVVSYISVLAISENWEIEAWRSDSRKMAWKEESTRWSRQLCVRRCVMRSLRVLVV